jgi:hypothetical protein
MRSPEKIVSQFFEGFLHIPQLGDVREHERADKPNQAIRQLAEQPPPIRQNPSPPLAGNLASECERILPNVSAYLKLLAIWV